MCKNRINTLHETFIITTIGEWKCERCLLYNTSRLVIRDKSSGRYAYISDCYGKCFRVNNDTRNALKHEIKFALWSQYKGNVIFNSTWMCFVYFQCLVHNCIFYADTFICISTNTLQPWVRTMFIKPSWTLIVGKRLSLPLATAWHFFVWMEHTDISGTWGAIIVMVLPKQMPSTSCQEDSQVSAHIALEGRGGGTAKPVYPKASGIMWVPCLCVFVLQPPRYVSG